MRRDLLGMTAQDKDGGTGEVVQQTAGLDEIAHALVLVGDTLGCKEDVLAVKGQAETPTRLLTVATMIDVGVDGVGDAGDLLSLKQGTGFRLAFKPSAAGDVVDVLTFEHPLFLVPDAGGEVVVGASARKQAAVVTDGSEVSAAEGDVTERCSRPDVVHRPDHGFARAQNLADGADGEHALIDPMEVDDVGLLELRQAGDVRTGIGKVDLKEMTTGEMEPTIDDEAFPEEMPVEQRRFGQGYDSKRVAEFVAHQHLRLDPVVVEGHHQTVGCDGSTT